MASAASTAPIRRVCVTGGSGFIASWIVKQLLEGGYDVVATVRNPADTTKTAHLRAMEPQSKLTLVEADLTKEGSFDRAVEGCDGVIHCASPFFFKGVTDPDAQLLNPAKEGTLNVLRSCAKANVPKVVLTSSMASVMAKEAPSADHVWTEADWSDEDRLRQRGSWYPLSKTIAERAAWEFAEANPSMKLVVINPTLVCGRMLQSTLNTSSEMILDYLRGAKEEIPASCMSFVDVEDTARAHVLALESSTAEGRHICVGDSLPWEEVVGFLRELAPPDVAARLPTKVADGEREQPTRYNKSKLEGLGLKWTPVKEIMRRQLEGLEKHGFLR